MGLPLSCAKRSVASASGVDQSASSAREDSNKNCLQQPQADSMDSTYDIKDLRTALNGSGNPQRVNDNGLPFPAQKSSTHKAYYCFENGYDSDVKPFVACGVDVAKGYVGRWFGAGRRVGRSPRGFESLDDALNYMDSKGLEAVLVRWRYPSIRNDFDSG